jgi:membrane protease YdiL (CAAX protease family)
MNAPGFRPAVALAAVALAFALWYFSFAMEVTSFWVKISFSAACLGAIAIGSGTLGANNLSFDHRGVIQGLAAAVLLYFVFWTGNFVARNIFPFAASQVGSIYGKGQGFSTTTVFLLLMFVTGPCEEIFWRGYLQRGLMERLGEWKGFLLTTAVYTGIHLCSLNFMLIGASAVAGLFWGLMYLKFRRLDALIVCHSVWSACIFAVVPIR